MAEHKVVDGTDLILSVGGSALGYSTGCKISTTTETGERVTKEATSGKWKEKYVKSFSESISADGFVVADGYNTYAELKAMQLQGKPVDASYGGRDSVGPSGSGQCIITSLELDAQAGDDAKYSIQLENTGKISGAPDSGTVGG